MALVSGSDVAPGIEIDLNSGAACDSEEELGCEDCTCSVYGVEVNIGSGAAINSEEEPGGEDATCSVCTFDSEEVSGCDDGACSVRTFGGSEVGFEGFGGGIGAAATVGVGGAAVGAEVVAGGLGAAEISFWQGWTLASVASQLASVASVLPLVQAATVQCLEEALVQPQQVEESEPPALMRKLHSSLATQAKLKS